MTNQHRALHLSVAHDGINCARKKIHAVINLWLVTLAMSGKIDRDHAIPFCEVGNLVAPVIQIAGPTMNQNERVTTLAVIHIMDPRAIEPGKVRFSCGDFLGLG